ILSILSLRTFGLFYLRRKRSKRQNCHHFLLSLIFHFFFPCQRRKRSKESNFDLRERAEGDVYMREVRKLFLTLGRDVHIDMLRGILSDMMKIRKGIFPSFHRAFTET